MAFVTCAWCKLWLILGRATSGWRLSDSEGRFGLGSHRVIHEKSSHHQRPGQQRDQLVPSEEPVVPSPVSNESSAGQQRVLADKGKVPNRMENIAVNRGLRNVEQTHRDERRIIARAVPFKTTLVFFLFR